MRRDRRHHDSAPVAAYAPSPAYVLEAGGLPDADERKALLRRRMAERLGIVAPEPIDLQTPEKFTELDLGNKYLPIYEHKQRILDSIRDNLITIVVAETGAGKSTQVPQYLFAEGYNVIMTQPRRIAAQMLSEQIDREIVESLDKDGYGYVGYQTARNNTINDRTRISVVTDGLRLVQELNERDEIDDEVLVIDEVHEWNTNMELLVALVKKMTKEKPRLRVVIMSATIDAEKLATYFVHDHRRPPIIEVPGRTHEVTMTEEPASDVVKEAVKHAMEDKTVLVFLPGLREIQDTQDQIRRMLHAQGRNDVQILSLHGDMSPLEQEAISKTYHGPKIICATNVAQTSITIPDVDVVVDSGLERRVMIDEEGTTSLELNHVSRADCRQRAGRCGRTHEGTYVLTRYISSEMRKKQKSNDTLGIFRFVGLDEQYSKATGQGRLEYPIPEIRRTNADRSTLLMAGAGLDLRKLDLYHPMKDKVLDRSKNLLRVLGAFDVDNAITQRGRRMRDFPVRPSIARMLTYAEENNFPQETKSYVAAMAAAMETGGLPDYGFDAGKEWRDIAPERSSDYLAQLKIYLDVQETSAPGTLMGVDLNPRRVADAKKTHEKLLKRMKIPVKVLPKDISPQQVSQISDAVVSGMIDFVYTQQGGEYRRSSEKLGRNVTLRVLSDRSMVRGASHHVVGTPYKIPPQHGREEKHILQDVHKTTPAQLAQVAFELCNWKDESTVWRDGRPKVKQRLVFRDTIPVDQWRETDAKWTPELRDIILQEVKRKHGPELSKLYAIKDELEQLWNRTKEVERLTQDEIDALLSKLATRGVLSAGQLDDKLRTHMQANNMNIGAYVSGDKRDEIMERSPEFMEWKGLNLQIQYKSGRPILRHVNDKLEADLLERNGDLKLSDGRDIYLTRRRKQFTLWQLRQERKR